MRFCSKCDNLLLTKEGKLYCRSCKTFFKAPPEVQKEYVLVKEIKHEDNDFGPIIVKERVNDRNISQEDRKAHEEFFLQA